MPHQPIDTIEKLALATADEFGAVHDELAMSRTEMRAGFAAVTEILNSVLHEVRQIRIADLERRIALIERHVGLIK